MFSWERVSSLFSLASYIDAAHREDVLGEVHTT